MIKYSLKFSEQIIVDDIVKYRIEELTLEFRKFNNKFCN